MPTLTCFQGLQDAEFNATGVEAMQIQERMFQNYLRATTIRCVASYSLAALCAVGAFTLILFGPSGRETTINVFSASLILMAAGIAGFSQFRTRGFGFEVAASRAVAKEKRSTLERQTARHPDNRIKRVSLDSVV